MKYALAPKATHAIALVIGLAAGNILFSPSNQSDELKRGADKTGIVEPTETINSPAQIALAKNTVEGPINNESSIQLNESSSELGSVDTIQLSDDVSDTGSSMTTIVATLEYDMLGSSESEETLDEFNEWLKTAVNPAREIFDYLASGIDEESKHVMQYMIAMSDNQALGEMIVSEISAAPEGDHAVWESMMEVLSIATSEARTELLSVLPNITTPSLVSASLQAMSPAILPSNERAEFLGEMTTYAAHADEDIRAAAIGSIGAWSAHEYQHVISNELSMGTEKTKQAAIYAIGTAGFKSEEMKNGLVNILIDQDASSQMKLDAFNVLGGFPLSGHDYDLQYEFYINHVLPLEQLANQG